MFSRSAVVLGAAAAVAVLTPSVVVEAHQRVLFPEVVYTVADRNTNWGPQAKLEKQGYKTSADFNGYLTANNYTTLREFMDKPGAYKPNKGATFECGYSDPNAPPQPIPKDGAFRTSGYTHDGPCEIWLDDVMVRHGKNCHKDISDTAFTDKIDYSSCIKKGKCMLKWYWLGVRPLGTYSWQIYKVCIPLAATASGQSAASNATSPVAPTQAPAAATPAPDAETGNDDDKPTPKPVTPLPPSNPSAAPVTEKPAGEANSKPSKGSKGCRRLFDE